VPAFEIGGPHLDEQLAAGPGHHHPTHRQSLGAGRDTELPFL
jgi:hypothetical protein